MDALTRNRSVIEKNILSLAGRSKNGITGRLGKDEKTFQDTIWIDPETSLVGFE